MKILQRREFLKRLGYMMVGGLIVPYVPKVFYSFPIEIVEQSSITVWDAPSGVRFYLRKMSKGELRGKVWYPGPGPTHKLRISYQDHTF